MLYRTIDWYEGKEIIYKGNSLKDALKARKQRYMDTDFEADITIEQCMKEEGKQIWLRNTIYG